MLSLRRLRPTLLSPACSQGRLLHYATRSRRRLAPTAPLLSRRTAPLGFQPSVAFSSAYTHLQDFPLADIGEGISECEVMEWYVKPGDHIEEFDKVCSVQSDKATVEISSRYEGTVHEIKYAVGDMAIVGTPLMSIYTAPPSGEASAADAPKSENPAPAATVGGAAPAAAEGDGLSPRQSGAKVKCSPAVRRMAKEQGIDLADVVPTGPDGRVLKGDVLNHIQNGPASPATAAAASPAPTAATPAAPAAAAPVAAPPSGVDQVIPITGLDRIMVRTMEAANQVPTLLYADEIVMDKLMELRELTKPFAEKSGLRPSPLCFLIKATSMALSDYPMMNAHVNADCTQVTRRALHNIGFAMDTPRGLLVPNIKDVANKSVMDIAAEMERMRVLGQEGKLGPEDLKGGTFTLSNIGSIGGTYTRPLIVVPEVCIGALGKTQTLPRYNDKMELVPQRIMVVSWSADHRVLDGATVARFGNRVKEIVEDPLAAFLLNGK